MCPEWRIGFVSQKCLSARCVLLSYNFIHEVARLLRRYRAPSTAIFAAMLTIFVPFMILAVWSEQHGNPAFSSLGVDQVASAVSSGGNMEGKEVRFGVADSGIWSAATTAADTSGPETAPSPAGNVPRVPAGTRRSDRDPVGKARDEPP